MPPHCSRPLHLRDPSAQLMELMRWSRTMKMPPLSIRPIQLEKYEIEWARGRTAKHSNNPHRQMVPPGSGPFDYSILRPLTRNNYAKCNVVKEDQRMTVFPRRCGTGNNWKGPRRSFACLPISRSKLFVEFAQRNQDVSAIQLNGTKTEKRRIEGLLKKDGYRLHPSRKAWFLGALREWWGNGKNDRS